MPDATASAPKRTRTAKAEFLVPEIEVRISKPWLRIIQFCQTQLTDGQVCFKIANSQPTELVDEHTHRRIRFDKDERTVSVPGKQPLP